MRHPRTCLPIETDNSHTARLLARPGKEVGVLIYLRVRDIGLSLNEASLFFFLLLTIIYRETQDCWKLWKGVKLIVKLGK